MAKLFKDLLEQAAQRESVITKGGVSIDRKTLEANAEVLKRLMRSDGSAISLPKIPMSEALGTADASILFPKVINDVLVRPVEPTMVAANRLAKVINVDGAWSVFFPTIGAIRAGEVGETQNYPEAHPSFSEHSTEVRTRKYGLKIPISEDVIADSMWDVLAMFVEAGGYAMARYKEELCFKELRENSHVVFDNSLANAEAWTTGVGEDNKLNGTLSYNDLVDAIGVLISNEYVPTDITLHPMVWAVFAKDPIMQFQMLMAGNAGGMFGNIGPDSIGNTLPVAFNVNITPFVNYTVGGQVTVDSVAYTGDLTDIFITDRNQSLVLLVREGISTEDWRDPEREIRMIKIKERYGVGTLNNGKSSIALKNIRVARNFEPVFTVRQFSPA